MTPEELANFNTEHFKAQFKKERELKPLQEGGNKAGGSYEFIARLLLHPVSDGRHRLLWLVLAPYAVSILKMPRDDAIDLVRKYLEECDKLKPCSDVINMVEQYIDYAAQVDLKPPKLVTIEDTDPDLFAVIMGAIS